jgi:hypothetical protein
MEKNNFPNSPHTPFSLSLSKGRPWFNKHAMNGLTQAFRHKDQEMSERLPSSLFKPGYLAICRLDRSRLNMGFKVLGNGGLQQRMQSRFPALLHVIHEFEKTKINRQLFLGNAPACRNKAGSGQRPLLRLAASLMRPSTM